jgi:hypothetical protein
MRRKPRKKWTTLNTDLLRRYDEVLKLVDRTETTKGEVLSKVKGLCLAFYTNRRVHALVRKMVQGQKSARDELRSLLKGERKKVESHAKPPIGKAFSVKAIWKGHMPAKRPRIFRG